MATSSRPIGPQDAEGSAHVAWGPTLVAFVVPVIALALTASYYHPFFSDDGFISLRYSERLLQGKGLTWTDGERVEGYSNLLWVLGCSLLGLFHDLVTAARTLGFGAGLAMIAALVRLFPPRSWKSALPATTAGLIVATSGPVAVWAVGGLEANLLGALWLWAIVLVPLGPVSPRSLVWRSIPAALACWTRPDGLLLALLVGLVLGLRTPTARIRTAVTYGALPLAFVLTQLGFRLAYYGDYVPNPAHIKLSGSRLDEGLAYVGDAYGSFLPVMGLVALGIVGALRGVTRRPALVAVVTAACWSGYIIAIGGDAFPGYRHFLPVIVCSAVLSAVGLRWLTDGSRGSRFAGGPAPLVLALVVLGLNGPRQFSDARNQSAAEELWEWGGEVMGNLFREAFEDKAPLLAVDAAGALPFFSRLPALDMYGLCDRHIAQTSPTPGRRVGHDHGDGPYVLSREPDLVVFRLPWGGAPNSVSGKQMVELPEFAEDYVRIRFDGLEPFRVQNQTFVRVEGRVGLERTPDALDVPAYLFTGKDLRGQALLDRSMGVLLAEKARGSTPEFELEPGAWRVTVDPPEARVAIGLVPTPHASLGSRPGILEVSQATEMRLTVRAGDLEASFAAVRLERWDDADSSPSFGEPAEWLHDGRVSLHRLRRDDATDVPELVTWEVGTSVQRSEEGLAIPPGVQRGASATSPPFRLPERGVLSLEMKGEGAVVLRLVDEATRHVLRAWYGADPEGFRKVLADLSELAGRTVRLRFEQEPIAPDGHATFRDLSLLRY